MGKRKRIGQLTTEEKLQLASNAGRMQEEGVSLNKIARQESRKGGQKALANIVNPTVSEPVVESNIPTDDPIKGPVKYEPTVVSTTIAKENPPGSRNYTMEPSQVEVPYGLDKIAENTAIAQARNEAQLLQADSENVANNAAIATNSAQTPGDAVNDKIENQAIKDVMVGNYDPTKIDAEQSAAAQVNKETAKSGQGTQALASLTEQAVNNPNIASDINTNDLNDVTTDLEDAYNYGDPEYDRKLSQLAAIVNKPGQRYAEPAVERLGLTDYYPDMNQGIRVGGYSGSIVGNNDIMVAQGGILPMGVMDARSRALEKAAAEKAKTKDKLFEMATVQAAYPYQKQLDTEIMDYNSKFGELVGFDWNKLAPGSSKLAMEYWDGVKKRQTLGRATKEIHAKAEQLFKDMTSEGKMHVSSEQQKLMSDWYMGKFKMDEVLKSPERERQFYDLAKKMKAYDNVSYYSQEASKVLKASMDKMPIKIKEGLDMKDPKIAKAYADMYAAKQTNDYDMYTKAMLTFVDDDRVTNAAKGLLDQHRFSVPGSEEQKLNYVKGQVMSYLGKQLDIDEKIQSVYNRERLSMDRAKHNWAKEDRVTFNPYKNIYNNSEDVDTKNNVINMLSKGDVTQATKFLGDRIGGTKTKTTDGRLIYDIGYTANKNDQFTSSLKETYSPNKLGEVFRKYPKAKEFYYKNGDATVTNKTLSKQIGYYLETPKGRVPVTEKMLKADPNLYNKVSIYAMDDIQPTLTYKEYDSSLGKEVTKTIDLPVTMSPIKLDVNGVAEMDARLKANMGKNFNVDVNQGAESTQTTEHGEGSTQPDM